MRTGFGLALAAAIALAAGGAAQEKDSPVDAKKLVGKWEPAEAKKGTHVTLEFTADGKLVIVSTFDTKSEKFEGTYKLTGNKIAIAMRLKDQEVKQEVTVLKLTDAELDTEDAKGKKETFKRAENKK
jgi:uncharacterized protein (TIGR03066 family)